MNKYSYIIYKLFYFLKEKLKRFRNFVSKSFWFCSFYKHLKTKCGFLDDNYK